MSLPKVNFFAGYSLGEDIFLSRHANRRGALVLSPTLRVRHHCSPVARDRRYDVGRSFVRNHSEIMRMFDSSDIKIVVFRITLIVWATLCLAIRTIQRRLDPFFVGVLSAAVGGGRQ